MKLLDYLGMSVEWPPPIQASEGLSFPLDHCRDVVVKAIEGPLSTPRKHQIVISTVFEGKDYTRSLFVEDKVFASAFWAFLNKQRAKTVEEIGNISTDEVSQIVTPTLRETS